MDHNLLGLGILSFQKYEISTNQLITSYFFFMPDSPIKFPLLFTEDPGFNLTVYLGKHEATSCECKKIVFEPDELLGDDDDVGDESDLD